MTKQKKPLSVQKQYNNLLAHCNEMRDYLRDLLDDQEQDRIEMEFLCAFISYKNLDEEYRYFREHVHEQYSDDMPFPTLTL